MNPVIVRDLNIGVGMPKICVPIVGESECEILEAAKEICSASVDLVEWRVDWFESAMETEKVKLVLEKLRTVLGNIPLLFTFRTKEEGGEREITYEQYAELLTKVAATKQADIIDVEAFMDPSASKLIAIIHNYDVKVMGSNHDFVKTPSKAEIVQRLCHMQDMGADLLKIAVMPQTEDDVFTLLKGTHEMVSKYAKQPVVTMSMSETGMVSRVAGEIFGSAITFGTMGKASAPGQLPIQKLKEVLEILHREEQE